MISCCSYAAATTTLSDKLELRLTTVDAAAMDWLIFFIFELDHLLQLCAVCHAATMICSTISWLICWNYELSDLLQLFADWRTATMIYESRLTCCNYELTPIRSKKSEPIVITTANNSTVSLKIRNVNKLLTVDYWGTKNQKAHDRSEFFKNMFSEHKY
jgi:hypothetical protein